MNIKAIILYNIISTLLEIEIASRYESARMSMDLPIILLDIGHLKDSALLEFNNITIFRILNILK